MSSRRLALVLAGLLFSAALAAQPQDRDAPYPAIPGIRVSDLPHEARETLTLIRAGGPLPHARDGSVFGIREGLPLPAARSTCREYTVMTSSRKNRGARRIVAGRRAEFHYTKDH